MNGLDAFANKHSNSSYAKQAVSTITAFADSMYAVSSKVNTIESWQQYQKALPENYWKDSNQQISSICDLLYSKAVKSNTVQAWNDYIKSVPSSEQRDSQQKLKDCYTVLYNKAVKNNTIAAWTAYMSQVPESEYKDSETRISQLKEEQKWKTESTAWNAANENNSISSYEKYLSYHPNGAHAATARKRIIDLKVNEVYRGVHGDLPSMDHNYYSYGSTSTVSISNDTDYTMTALYSGSSQSKELTVPPHSTRSVSLVNGTYRIAVSVSSRNVSGYYGTEILTGGVYSASYYIVTTQY